MSVGRHVLMRQVCEDVNVGFIKTRIQRRLSHTYTTHTLATRHVYGAQFNARGLLVC